MFEDLAPSKLKAMLLIVATIKIKKAMMLSKFIARGMFVTMSELKMERIFVAASKVKATTMRELKAKELFVATSKLKAMGVGESVIILSGGFLGGQFDVLPCSILV